MTLAHAISKVHNYVIQPYVFEIITNQAIQLSKNREIHFGPFCPKFYCKIQLLKIITESILTISDQET